MQEKDSGVKDLSGAGDGADEISGATNEEKGSCLEVLGERTKRKGVWLVISLDVKELEWPVGIVFVWKEEPSVYFWVPDKGLLRRRC